MIVGNDPEGLFSVEGCPLLPVEGCCEGLFPFGLSLVDESWDPELPPESFLLFEKDT